MRNASRIAIVVGSLSGAASMATLVYASRFYAHHSGIEASLKHPYVSVLCLHLLMPILSAVASAVLVARLASPSVPSVTTIVSWIVLSSSLLLLANGYTRSLYVLGLPSDTVAAGLMGRWEQAEGLPGRLAITVLEPLGQIFIGIALIVIMGAAHFRRRVVALPRALRVTLSSWVMAALLVCLHVVYYLVTRVSIKHYGTIAAFCWMVACLIGLPLGIAALTALMIARNSSSAWLMFLWLGLSAAAIGFAVSAIVGFVRLDPFAGPAALEEVRFHGMCALIGNRRLILSAVTISVATISYVASRRIGLARDVDRER